MENNWKDFLYFSKSERNGLFVLLLLALLLLLARLLFTFSPQTTNPDFSVFEKEVAAFLAAQSEATEKTAATKSAKDSLFVFNPNTTSPEKLRLLGLPDKVVSNLVNYRKKGGRFFRKTDLQKIYGMRDQDYQRLLPYIDLKAPAPRKQKTSPANDPKPKKESPLAPAPVLQNFDPNTASPAELIALGIPPRAANTLKNFRQKGGTFRKKEDLQKVFGISPALYQDLEPFIQINPPPPKPKAKKPDLPLAIDINQATAEDWQKLKGIGPVYAQRIVKWRDKLGGFHSTAQVGKTYGLPDSTFQKILPSLQTSPVQKKLSINLASVADLQNHPYLNYRQANAIVNYRKHHGKFTQWEELRKVKVLSDQTIQQIKPYLLFE